VGFQRHGVVPDLVTMGKPMGNGHPVAAVAARPEVFARFAKRRHYFNTYGGNSVSCAAALAVLRVIREENLLENARRTGEHLKRACRRSLSEIRRSAKYAAPDCSWASSFAPIRRAGSPASAEAKRVVNGMCRRGVLVGSTGRHGDVLKIRSPLTFETQHADLLLEALEQTLKEKD